MRALVTYFPRHTHTPALCLTSNTTPPQRKTSLPLNLTGPHGMAVISRWKVSAPHLGAKMESHHFVLWNNFLKPTQQWRKSRASSDHFLSSGECKDFNLRWALRLSGTLQKGGSREETVSGLSSISFRGGKLDFFSFFFPRTVPTENAYNLR